MPTSEHGDLENPTKSAYSVQMTPIENKNGYIVCNKKILEKLTKRVKIYDHLKRSRALWFLYHFNQKYLYPIVYYFFGNSRSFWRQLKRLKIEKIVYYFSR